MMADRSEKFLLDLLSKDGNGVCADCGAAGPRWSSYNIGVFLCDQCAGVHRSLGTHISKVKSLKLDRWEDDQLKIMEAEGNLKGKERYEQQVPLCYKRPTPSSPNVLREQWVRAKYERLEFSNPDQQSYTCGLKDGYLWKRGKDDKKFFKRKFVLNGMENTLKYFVKDSSKEPKCSMQIDYLNVTLVPEKVGNPNGMQITFEQDGHTRNLFVYAEAGQELINWYTAIRAAKLNRLRIAYPGADDSELCQHLTRDFTKEGWLSKTGPRTGDAYRKRWFTLEKRKLMYYEDPLDAFPRGEIFVGTRDRKYNVVDGVPKEIKDLGFCFTLCTPDREYHFSAETQVDKLDWMEKLVQLLDLPLSPQDTSSMVQFTTKKRSSKFSLR